MLCERLLKWLSDFKEFAGLYSIDVQPDCIVHAGSLKGVNLYLGWICDKIPDQKSSNKKGVVTEKKCPRCGHHGLSALCERLRKPPWERLSMQYPKAVRKELNTLASTAYERELECALGDLYESFKKWKNKQIDCFELNQLIHEFHQKKSREIWSTYNRLDSDFNVVRAVRLGILEPGEISTKTAEAINLDRHMGGDGERDNTG